MMSDDERYMRMALDQAVSARSAGEVPVGAVICRDGAIIASGFNQPLSLSDPTAHAEVVAIRRAAEVLGNYRLTGTTLYVTLEPCLMCAGAILHARIGRLVFGARDPKGGAVVSIFQVLQDARLNHRLDVMGGVLEKECGEILSSFFSEKRICSPSNS